MVRLHDVRTAPVWMKVVCFLVVCLLWFVPHVALAAWPVSAGEQTVVLGFHERYAQHLHLGADLPARAGASIVAPCDGVVSFAGEVPASGGGGGSTMNAVSLRLSDGRTFTMMPLASIHVSEGSSVDEGAPIGTLAASGDGSVASPHLHVGLKDETSYFDPLEVLGMSSNSSVQGSRVSMQAAVAASGMAGGPAVAEAEDPDGRKVEEVEAGVEIGGVRADEASAACASGTVSSGNATLPEEPATGQTGRSWPSRLSDRAAGVGNSVASLLVDELGLSGRMAAVLLATGLAGCVAVCTVLAVRRALRAHASRVLEGDVIPERVLPARRFALLRRMGLVRWLVKSRLETPAP